MICLDTSSELNLLFQSVSIQIVENSFEEPVPWTKKISH